MHTLTKLPFYIGPKDMADPVILVYIFTASKYMKVRGKNFVNFETDVVKKTVFLDILLKILSFYAKLNSSMILSE